MRRPDEASSRVSDHAVLDEPGSRPPGVHGVRPELSNGRSVEFEPHVEEVRRLLASGESYLFNHLEDRLRRLLGIAPLSLAATGLIMFVGVGTRLTLALLGSAALGALTEIPWGRWVVILAFFGLVDVGASFMNRPIDMPSSPAAEKMIAGWTAMLPTLTRESDARDLIAFARRWARLRVPVAIGVGVAGAMLLAAWLLTPAALSELQPGTVVLLALLLYEFGEGNVYGDVFRVAFVARGARYEHDLFWPSPVDTPQLRTALRMGTRFGLITGIWSSCFVAMTVALVSWDSPVVVPLAVGFTLIGYLLTVGATLVNRSNIQKIVERSRERWLTVLQERIRAFGTPVTELDPQDVARLDRLIDLHNRLRDAPAMPTTTRTVVRAAASWIIPTITFVITVFGEVYAERIFDTILP